MSVATAAAVLVSIAAAQTLMAVTLLAWIALRPRAVRWPGWVLPAGAFMLATLLSLASSPDPSIGWGPVRKFVLFAMGLIAASFVRDEQRLRSAVTALLVVGAVGSAVAVVQFIVQYMEFRSTGLIGDDPTILARATGFMGHWMTFSGEQMLVWCVAIPLVWTFRTRFLWVPLSLIGIGILLSFTRSVWVGAAAGVGIMALYLPPRLLLRMMIPIAVIGLIASGLVADRIARSFIDEDFVPDSSRLEMLEVGSRMVRDHPLLGVGPERVGVEFTDYYEGSNIDVFYYGHLHNNFMQIAAERGLLSLAALLWLMGRIGVDLVRFSRSSVPSVKWSGVSGLAVLGSFLVAGLFEYNFGDSEMLMLFLFLVSIPYGMAAGTPEVDVPAAVSTRGSASGT